jgi:hypothetical protein
MNRVSVLLRAWRRVPVAALVLLALGATSRTAWAGKTLAGDSIDGFRVVAVEPDSSGSWNWKMKVEVLYSYHPAHGRAIVGAELLPKNAGFTSGHSYWGTESGPEKAVEETVESRVLVRGLQRVAVAVRVAGPQVTTSQLRVYLYSAGGEEFLSRTFDEPRTWTAPPAGPFVRQPKNLTASAAGPFLVADALPDLVIVSGMYEPASPVAPGTTVRFHFQVANRGPKAAAGFVRVSGPGNFSGGFAGGLSPGETREAIVDYPVYSKGTTYKLRFAVNSENTIKESNFDNNSSAEFVIETTN